MNLKNQNEWIEHCKSGKKPNDIPANPDRTYKNNGWKDTGDWLGTGTIAPRLRKYRPFEEARAFVHELNFKSGAQWSEYCKGLKKPDDIPACPNQTYKDNGWQGMGDWLGTGIIATQLMPYRPFEEARVFVHTLNLKGQTEWLQYCKSGKKPNNIPAKPDQTYKDKGWEGMGDWLGTGFIAAKYREFRLFEDAREFVRSLNLKSWAQWKEYCISGKKPDDIPAAPHRTYKDEGWEGTGDWLGTGIIAAKFREFRPFKEAIEFVHTLNLKSGTQWREYCRSDKKPGDIPTNPHRTYKDKGWQGMGDWLGTGTITPRLRECRPFEDAREFARSLNFKNRAQWNEYCKSGKKPDDIPVHPDRTYKDEGWKGMGDWLGTGTIASQQREYRLFEEARAFVHSLNLKSWAQWSEYCKSGKKPEDIPAYPNQTYKDKGWQGMGDWLGKDK